jgi:hypothetical protein
MDTKTLEPLCWSSTNRVMHTGGGYSFMISVVLDADTWKLFSGIRVVLVYRETSELPQNVASSQ